MEISALQQLSKPQLNVIGVVRNGNDSGLDDHKKKNEW